MIDKLLLGRPVIHIRNGAALTVIKGFLMASISHVAEILKSKDRNSTVSNGMHGMKAI